MNPLDGITIFINGEDAREISEEAERRGFFGIIVACLSRRPMNRDIVIVAHQEWARLLKERGEVPQDCRVRFIGPVLADTALAGLIVNYTDAK